MIPNNGKDPQKFIRNIPKDLILAFLTLGIWNIYLQSIQIEAVNEMLGANMYSFFKWLFFIFLTFGIYHLYHEYKISSDIEKLNGRINSNIPTLHLIISIFGMSVVADALQQEEINKFFSNKHQNSLYGHKDH